MPITQPRMISLIAAAMDFQQAFFQAIEGVRALQIQAREGLLPAEAALARAAILVSLDLLQHPVQSNTAIATEQAHFRKYAKRNEYHTRLARRKRLERTGPRAPKGDPLQPKLSAFDTIVQQQRKALPQAEAEPGQLNPEDQAEFERWHRKVKAESDAIKPE